MAVKLNLPLSEWPIFYIEGEPYIYDDTYLFYDENGEPLGQHTRHSTLAIYLYNLLSWVYRNQLCTVTFDLYLKAEIELIQNAAADAAGQEVVAARVSPDVAFIKGIPAPDTGTYVVDVDGPPPNVIFEVGSQNTFTDDLGKKFELYAIAYRAKEYYAYDPREKRLWKGSRLKAWRLINGEYEEIKPDERGWVWSEELQKWLVPDGKNLWLYNPDGTKCLTSEEEAKIQTELARAEAERAKAEAERADKAEQVIIHEKQARIEAQQEAAEKQKEVENANAYIRQLEQEKQKETEASNAYIRQLEEEIKKRNQAE